MSFNWKIYSALNSDLKKAGLVTQEQITKHYIIHGKLENRIYDLYKLYPNFNYTNYKKNYPDLKDMNKNELELHWLIHGIKEGRSYSSIHNIYSDFDSETYKKNYPDLKDMNKNELELHWLKNGEKEGRSYNKIIESNDSCFNDTFKNITTIKYFTHIIVYYSYKMSKYVKIIKNYFPQLTEDTLNINNLLFNNYNFDLFSEEFDKISTFLNNSTQEDFFILDEISYCHLLGYYLANNNNKKLLEDFLIRTKYIVFFSELFESKEKMNTIGNTMYDINFTKMYFSNAYKCCLCDVNNIILLYDLGIYTNIIYFPPTGYSKIVGDVPLITYDYKPIDVLIYGSIDKTITPYRYETIEFLKKTLLDKGYNIVVREKLYEAEKDELLKKTKIVIHIPMLKSQYSFPWAKCSELMAKKIFFILDTKTPDVEFTLYNKLIIPVINFSYKDTVLHNIEKYLNDEKYRNIVIENNYNYVKTNYDIDLLLCATLQKNKHKQLLPIKNMNIKIKNIVVLYTQTNNYHNTQKIYVLNYFKNNNYKTNIINVFFLKNNELILNHMKSIIEDTNYISNTLYIFNAEDYYQFYCMLNPNNIEIIYSFLSKINYIYFCYEVLSNNKLDQIGLNTTPHNVYSSKFYYNFEERFDFVLHFFRNSKLILSSNADSIKYLNENKITNVIYFSPIGYSPAILYNNTTIHNKTIDVLFYGNQVDELTYRNNILDQISLYCTQNKFVFEQYNELIDNKKINKLSESKIVIHIPSHEKLETFPWAKCAELFANNIFVIIEENKDIFENNMEDIVVYYKHGDINDLTNKIQYYINNKKQRDDKTRLCFEYFKNNFNMNKLLTQIK
jgi:hypothetical protein